MESKESPNPVFRIIHRIEDLFLSLILLTMVGFSFVQLVLRYAFQSGFNWGDSFQRQMVLWLGLMGAAVATRQDRHINVDISAKFLPPKWAAFTRIFTDAFAAVVCAIIAYMGLLLVKNEMTSGAMAFASVPAWIMELAIPLGFGIIALRFARMCFVHLLQAVGKKEIESQPAPDDGKGGV